MLYTLVMAVRNLLFDWGLKSVYTSPIKTMNIGNLAVGGTGKTPHVEYLIRLFQNKYHIATLSRGYGRNTSGFIAANDHSTADSIGDEPFQLFQKFNIPVFVSEKRAIGLQQIEQITPHIDLVLLDDAFQHRAISPTVNILLTDYNNLFVKDLVIPSGQLREWRTGATRADCLIVSKCPSKISEQEKEKIISQIQRYTKPKTPIFFSTIQYASPLPYFDNQPDFDSAQPIVLLSGIAQPQLFEQDARHCFKVAQHLIFRDHHRFTKQDLTSTQSKIVLTTEKDVAKIKPLLNTDSQFYYWPIKVQFLDNTTILFDEWIGEYLEKLK
jgi:tetraacyldisaccharide 4'-kinase